MRLTRPTSLARAIAVTPVLIAAAAAPGHTATVDERAPTWTADFEIADPDTTQWIGGSVVDPATGDVLTLVHNSDHPLKRRLRRMDGSTGQTTWETGLAGPGGSYPLNLALDPGGDRAVVSIEAPGHVYLHSVGLDGELGWSKTLAKRGSVADLVVDPHTGRACHATAEQPHRNHAGTPVWVLSCTDRAGNIVVDARTKVGGHRAATLEAMAVDPERGRWYLAGTQQTKRGSHSIVVALNDDGTRQWRRTLEHSSGGGHVAALVVDSTSHRVYLGGSSEQVRTRANGSRTYRGRAHVASWKANGKKSFERTWTDGRRGAAVTDLAVAGRSGRIVATTQGHSGGLDLRVMNSKGQLIHRVRQEARGENDGRGHVALDTTRQVVIVAGRRVVSYDWKGRRMWHSPSDDHFVSDLDHDPARGHVVVSWMSNGDPGATDAWVSTWAL